MAGFKIGTVSLNGNVILAPMAGVTDLPFRLLCKEQGAALMYTEMVSAKGIYYGNKNTESLLAIDDKERPVAVQLFGSDPFLMSEMARRIEHRNFDLLDINMGCPVPKVVNNGEGSALMKNIPRAAEIVNAVVRAIKKPVMVKFRKGFLAGDDKAAEMAVAMEEAGAAAVAIHGRTREQYYSGQADWETIRRVKEAVSIPVIGNGDIFSPADGKRMLEETGCDGIMIARGARGNPWIFKQIRRYMQTGECLPKPSFQEIVPMVIRHAKMQIHLRGELAGMREMRSHVAWYTAGYPHSAALRERVNQLETLSGLEQLLFEHSKKI